jgi:hypothetical protein
VGKSRSLFKSNAEVPKVKTILQSSGTPSKTFDKISVISEKLQIPKNSLYVIVGFFKTNDIRQMKYYIVPFSSLSKFENDGNYRFSPPKCEKTMLSDLNIKSI